MLDQLHYRSVGREARPELSRLRRGFTGSSTQRRENQAPGRAGDQGTVPKFSTPYAATAQVGRAFSVT